MKILNMFCISMFAPPKSNINFAAAMDAASARVSGAMPAAANASVAVSAAASSKLESPSGLFISEEKIPSLQTFLQKVPAVEVEIDKIADAALKEKYRQILSHLIHFHKFGTMAYLTDTSELLDFIKKLQEFIDAPLEQKFSTALMSEAMFMHLRAKGESEMYMLFQHECPLMDDNVFEYIKNVVRGVDSTNSVNAKKIKEIKAIRVEQTFLSVRYCLFDIHGLQKVDRDSFLTYYDLPSDYLLAKLFMMRFYWGDLKQLREKVLEDCYGANKDFLQDRYQSSKRAKKDCWIFDLLNKDEQAILQRYDFNIITKLLEYEQKAQARDSRLKILLRNSSQSFILWDKILLNNREMTEDFYAEIIEMMELIDFARKNFSLSAAIVSNNLQKSRAVPAYRLARDQLIDRVKFEMQAIQEHAELFKQQEKTFKQDLVLWQFEENIDRRTVIRAEIERREVEEGLAVLNKEQDAAFQALIQTFEEGKLALSSNGSAQAASAVEGPIVGSTTHEEVMVSDTSDDEDDAAAQIARPAVSKVAFVAVAKGSSDDGDDADAQVARPAVSKVAFVAVAKGSSDDEPIATDHAAAVAKSKDSTAAVAKGSSDDEAEQAVAVSDTMSSTTGIAKERNNSGDISLFLRTLSDKDLNIMLEEYKQKAFSFLPKELAASSVVYRATVTKASEEQYLANHQTLKHRIDDKIRQILAEIARREEIKRREQNSAS